MSKTTKQQTIEILEKGAHADDTEREHYRKAIIVLLKPSVAPLVEDDAQVIERAFDMVRSKPDDAWTIVEDHFAASEPKALNVTRQFEHGKAPQRTWLIDRWLPEGRAGLFTGEGGRGKSWLALQLAASLAAGESEWLPGADLDLLDATQAPLKSVATAVIWTAEDEPAEAHRRLDIMQPLDGGLDTADRLHVIDASGEGPLWAPDENIIRSAVGGLTDAGKRLRNYCAEYPPRLLVVDNLAAAFACNENDRAMVRAFMTSWDGWARETKCAVMFVAHPSRAHADFSGSTDWRAAARWLWSFGLKPIDDKDGKIKDSDKAPKLENLKSNYSPDGEGSHFWVLKQRSARWVASDKYTAAKPPPLFAPGGDWAMNQKRGGEQNRSRGL